jgi:hypothetical protein
MSAKKAKRESYNPRTKAITPAEYGDWQKAFDFFKEHLFKERWLPDVFITYQRRAHSRGYFSPDSFSARDGKSGKHELALNPNAFVDRTDEQIVSTLVHEMVHLWQHLFGKPPSRNYHNKEWAAKMESLGLMPSNTGAVGGKRTGAQMTHYIVPGGAFQQTFAALVATGWELKLQSTIRPGATKAPPSKVKFTCPACGWNVWGKPDSKVVHKPCACDMLAERADVGSYQQQAA